MKPVLILLAATLGLLIASKPLTAQTPYDDFAPSETPKPILSLPNAIYRITNTDTAAIVKSLLFEKQSQTLLYVGANDCLLAYEILQPRELKWWSVDPLANEAAGIGPYTFVDDNPVANVDPDGRKTLYYSQSGVLLFTSNDNLPDAISIVNDSDIKQFVKQYYNVNFLQDKVHSDDFNLGLRSLSMNYMVGGLIDLQNESNNTPLTNPDLYRDPNTNAAMPNLVPEIATYLYDDGKGNITVGPERFTGTPHNYSIGAPANSSPAARAHTHNNKEGEQYIYYSPIDCSRLGQITLHPEGPSPKDIFNSNNNDKYYDVVVDPKNINLHGGPGADIQVPISVFITPTP